MRRVVVRRTEVLSPSVRGIRLACQDGQPLSFIPGQWVNLHVDAADGRDKRAYSIASAPDRAHPDEFEIAVTRVETGKISLSLHALGEGSDLDIEGPYGFFTRADHEHDQRAALFVGTGTGVGPLRSMITAELKHANGPELTLLFGCRSEADILYRAEFEQLAAAHPRFSFEPTLSRPSAAWRGRRGYVQTQLADLLADKQRPEVYICGLSNMVNDVRDTLKRSLGYQRTQIHSERYD
jgi:CDP-4-dehydro-6-deoxyglucose reductase